MAFQKWVRFLLFQGFGPVRCFAGPAYPQGTCMQRPHFGGFTFRPSQQLGVGPHSAVKTPPMFPATALYNQSQPEPFQWLPPPRPRLFLRTPKPHLKPINLVFDCALFVWQRETKRKTEATFVAPRKDTKMTGLLPYPQLKVYLLVG